MQIRKILLRLHLYSGLVCFWYLIILGTSSLNFNHHFSWMESRKDSTVWSTRVNNPGQHHGDRRLSEALRDSLGLIGWPLPWETWRDSTALFHFALEHPGKSYLVDYNFSSQVARVQERPKSLWKIFNSMHGIGAVPNALFMHTWKWYSRITTLLVVLSIFTGIYIWYRGSRDRVVGWYLLVISGAISILWMLQIYLEG